MENLNLLTDQALGEGTSERFDGLGFDTYASVLADAVTGNPGPFTIGIFGEWGTGKTSLMRLVESKLDENKNVITVWFNAWKFEKEEHPIVPLVATIIREIERQKSFTEKMSDKGKSLINALRAVAYGFSAKTKVKVPGFAEIEASFVAKEMIDREKALTPDPLLDRSLYYEAFECLSALEFPNDSRVVVIIDDLDRCFPDKAVMLLESIKLVLSQPGFIFTIGVARRVIEGYLEHKYSEEYGIIDFKGQTYLDKIVQLPFHIPPHTGRLNDFSNKLLERINPSVSDQLKDILPVVGAASGGNPRSTIRFVNNLLIDLAISNALSNTSDMEVIEIEYFAVTRCLQQRWPDTFNTLISYDELCVAVASWDRSQIRNFASQDANEYSLVASALISDRELYDLLFQEYGLNWLKNSDKRNSTVQFLKSQRQESEPTNQYKSYRYDVFISYENSDRKDATHLAEILADEGVKVYFDSHLKPGEMWLKALERGMNESKGVMFCIGPKTQESEWVERELRASIKQKESKGKFIIPIILPGASFDDLYGELRHYQALKLSTIDRQSIEPLLKFLRSVG